MTMESHRTRSLVGVALGLVVATLACAANQPKAAEPDGQTVQTSEPVKPTMTDPASPMQPHPSTPEPMFACSQDNDCNVIEMGCCDHCNGGMLLSVNGEHTSEANAKYRPSSCTNTACTEMACAWTFAPVCDSGVCARREEHPQAGGQPKVAIVRNVLPTSGQ